MTYFEREWHDKYIANKVTLATLQKLVSAGKLTQEAVNAWVAERKEIYGI